MFNLDYSICFRFKCSAVLAYCYNYLPRVNKGHSPVCFQENGNKPEWRLSSKKVTNQLSDCQSGFWSLHSTLKALLEATNTWSVNIDDGILNGVVFVDLKKAFDTIDHEIICSRCRTLVLTTILLSGFNRIWATKVKCVIACEQAHLLGVLRESGILVAEPRFVSRQSMPGEWGGEKWACTQAMDFWIPCTSWQT